jgi:hypothetical protein
VEVPSAEMPPYRIHASLLIPESDEFRDELYRREAASQPFQFEFKYGTHRQFRAFAAFLYGDPILPDPAAGERSERLIELAKLYVFGEVIKARAFKEAVSQKFTTILRVHHLTGLYLIELLQIACKDITKPKDGSEDPMRDSIFWIVARNLRYLNTRPEFAELVGKRDSDIGTELIKRAADSDEPPPGL